MKHLGPCKRLVVITPRSMSFCSTLFYLTLPHSNIALLHSTSLYYTLRCLYWTFVNIPLLCPTHHTHAPPSSAPPTLPTVPPSSAPPTLPTVPPSYAPPTAPPLSCPPCPGLIKDPLSLQVKEELSTIDIV